MHQQPTFQILPPPSSPPSPPHHLYSLNLNFPPLSHLLQTSIPLHNQPSSTSPFLFFLSLTMSSSDSETSAAEMQSVLERLISSRNRDLSLFIPFLLGFTGDLPPSENPPSTNDSDDDHGRRDRIILINPLTQGMVVIEGTRLDALFRTSPEKPGQPPASTAAIEAMPTVAVEEEGECTICLDEWVVGETAKEMPCKHRFHGECIEKWLKMHGSCPVCRHVLPPEEEEDRGKKTPATAEERGRDGRREIWVSFSFGGPRRRTAGDGDGERDGDRSESGDSGDRSEGRESEMGN